MPNSKPNRLLGIERPRAVGVQNLEKRLGLDMPMPTRFTEAFCAEFGDMSLCWIGVLAAAEISQRLNWSYCGTLMPVPAVPSVAAPPARGGVRFTLQT